MRIFLVLLIIAMGMLFPIPAQAGTLLIGTGATANTNDAVGYVHAEKFLCSVSGNLTAIQTYSLVSTNVRVAVYSDNSNRPGTLLAESATKSVATGWISVVLNNSVPIIQGTYYWLAEQVQTAGGGSYLSGQSGWCYYHYTQSYGAFPANGSSFDGYNTTLYLALAGYNSGDVLPPPPPPLPTTIKVNCIGDSLTRGYPTGEIPFPADLQSALGDNYTVTNLGVDGETTAQILSRFSTAMSGASYVVVWGGTNDLTYYPVSMTESNLQSMYTMAHNAGIKVVAMYLTPYEGFGNWSASKANKILVINNWISTQATNIDYIVNTYDTVCNPDNTFYLLPTYNSGDYMHMSNTGYSAISNKIYSIVWNNGSNPIPSYNELSQRITLLETLISQ
jgi:lysophospholipase L1-like esterase